MFESNVRLSDLAGKRDAQLIKSLITVIYMSKSFKYGLNEFSSYKSKVKRGSMARRLLDLVKHHG